MNSKNAVCTGSKERESKGESYTHNAYCYKYSGGVMSPVTGIDKILSLLSYDNNVT